MNHPMRAMNCDGGDDIGSRSSLRLTYQEVSSRRRRVLLALLATFQNASVGGVLFGWASIDRSLLTASREQGGCGLSSHETTLIFSAASSTALAASLFLGLILDCFGPRVCSVISHGSIVLGFLILAISTHMAHYMLGVCLIAFGGPGIQVSVVHVSNLFGRRRYLVLSGLTGSMSLSFLVFPIMDLLWNHYGVTASHLFGGYVGVVLVSLMASILYLPDESLQVSESDAIGTGSTPETPLVCEPTPEDEYVEATTAHPHLVEQPLESFLRTKPSYDGGRLVARSLSFQLSSKALRNATSTRKEDEAVVLSIKDQPFSRQLISATYCRSVLFLVVTCFLANFYVASFSTEIADSRFYSNEEQHDLARILTYSMAGGFVVSFFVGWLMDHVCQEVCILTTLLLGQIHVLIVLVWGHNVRMWMMISFIIYVLFRQFLFPVFIANLTHHLGFKYFGLLNGIAFGASGLSQLYMSSLVAMTQGDCHLTVVDDPCFTGYWRQLHIIEIVCLSVLWLNPWLEYRDRLHKESHLARIAVDHLDQSYADASSLLFTPTPPYGTELSTNNMR